MLKINVSKSSVLKKTQPAALLALMFFAAIGCHKQPSVAVNPDQLKAFDDASPEIKQAWQNALASDATTNYLDTENQLQALKKMNLSTNQYVTVQTELDVFHYRLVQAAEKNDPAAVQAVLQIQKH
jgi:hypothetical protein